MTNKWCSPATPEELEACLRDPEWRLFSGHLYKIMVKGEDGAAVSVIPFIPNRAQRKFIRRLWYRNIILKARQLGFTTLIAILWLDHALFNPNQRCGMQAQDKPSAEAIFRDKVKFAYDNLPEELKLAMPLQRDSASELLFAHNNSSVRVATSMRSGTIHRLHVSEFGKICAKYPEKAEEVVTGSFQAVPTNGIIVVESTAEGQSGEFYEMTVRAMGLADKDTKLSRRDYRFNFFPWYEDETYQTDDPVTISDKEHAYFDAIEAEAGVTISLEQRKWYISVRDSDFSGDASKMWQEYPSTPKEAFEQSMEGAYYTDQLAAARKDGRVCSAPYVEGVPVNTFWDIGSSDGTAIWFHQRIGREHRFIRFIEGWGESYGYFIRLMQDMGYVWGTHYLPHDAGHKRQQGHTVEAPIDMLSAFGIGGQWEIVPRVSDVTHGIQMTRNVFSQCVFDEAGCKEGLAHLAAYRKDWDVRHACWSAKPRHDEHSEAADAFRQFAQGYRAPVQRAVISTQRRRGSAQAA